MHGDIPKREINEQLARILKSKFFSKSERLQRFLTYSVETALAGNAHRLKESVLGHVVFDRGEDFDPQKDSIVRTEAARLRRKLHEYYETVGKGDPVVVQFVEGSYLPTFSRARARRKMSTTTVAVVPFIRQCSDPEVDYFCDGITDDVIYALSRIPGLNVIGQTSVYAFRGKDAREAGAELGAGTVVTGSVRKSGRKVKISAEMIDAATGGIRWAETFERPADDIFAIQEEIAKAVARNLHTRSSMRRLIRDAPSMDAYLLFLRGRSAWHESTEEGYRRAAECFESAVSQFPAYATAHAALSDAYVRLALWGYDRPLEMLPKAVREAEAAMKLDPFLPHANSSFALSKVWSDWDWKAGVENAHKAIEIAPSYAFGHHVYGFTLLHGKVEDALESFERALTLDPFAIRCNRVFGYALYLARQYASADQWLLATEAIQETAETKILLARSYLVQGRVNAALELAKLAQVHPTGLSVQAACLAILGRKQEAHNIIEVLVRMAKIRWVQPRSLIRIFIALGEFDRAFEFLSISLDEREPFTLFMNHDPEFDPLREDPRFAELLARLDQKPSAPQAWEPEELEYASRMRRYTRGKEVA